MFGNWSWVDAPVTFRDLFILFVIWNAGAVIGVLLRAVWRAITETPAQRVARSMTAYSEAIRRRNG